MNSTPAAIPVRWWPIFSVTSRQTSTRKDRGHQMRKYIEGQLTLRAHLIYQYALKTI